MKPNPPPSSDAGSGHASKCRKFNPPEEIPPVMLTPEQVRAAAIAESLVERARLDKLRAENNERISAERRAAAAQEKKRAVEKKSEELSTEVKTQA